MNRFCRHIPRLRGSGNWFCRGRRRHLAFGNWFCSRSRHLRALGNHRRRGHSGHLQRGSWLRGKWLRRRGRRARVRRRRRRRYLRASPSTARGEFVVRCRARLDRDDRATHRASRTHARNRKSCWIDSKHGAAFLTHDVHAMSPARIAIMGPEMRVTPAGWLSVRRSTE